MDDKYRILLFRVLFDNFELSTAEEFLMKNKIPFIEKSELIPEEKLECLHFSKYFYLLNAIHTRFLSKEEMVFLKKIDENAALNQSVIEFIMNTYKKVLFRLADDYTIFYGPHSSKFQAKDNQIALGLMFEEYGFVGANLNDEETILKNNQVVDDVIKCLEKRYSNMNLKIIKYNELFKRMFYGNSINK